MPLGSLKSRYHTFAERVLSSLSEIERRDVRAFDHWFYRERGWQWLVWIFAGTTLAAAAASRLPWNMSFAEAALLFNVVIFLLLWSGLGAWFGYRKYRGKLVRFVLVTLGLVLVGASVGGTIVDLVQDRAPLAWLFDSASLRHLVTAALVFGFLYAALVALIANLRNREYVALSGRLEVEARQNELSRRLAESQLRMLQLQIEPHFLFNTLGSAQQLAEKSAPDAARLIAHLIRFLRAATPSLRENTTTLKDEAAMIGAYLAIMQTRLGKRLAYRIDIPAALDDATVPPGMLITLVENALKHGIEPLPDGGVVAVFARRERSGDDAHLVLVVADTGAGISDVPGSGIGLSNIRERLRLLYDGRAALELEENEPRGFVARLVLPVNWSETRDRVHP
jgi:signal transduction histidine kinase